MNLQEINTDLLIADAIIEAIEYEQDEYATLKEQTLCCDGNYFGFDVKITNVDYDRKDIYEGDVVIGYYYELDDFDFEVIQNSFKPTTRFRKESKLKNAVLTSDSDTVKEIVFKAI